MRTLGKMAAAAAVAWAAWGPVAAPCAAQPVQRGIDSVHKYSWAENCGWMNWSGAPGQGVVVTPEYLSGTIWCENLGWVRVSGAAAPLDAHHYANAGSEDYGVNISPAGLLSGFAWSENAGWINFGGGAQASPPNPARIDSFAVGSRFRGFAWGENIGWINLDDIDAFVEIGCGSCAADYDCNGVPQVADIFAMLRGWFAREAKADRNHDSLFQVNDIFLFIQEWFAGCP